MAKHKRKHAFSYHNCVRQRINYVWNVCYARYIVYIFNSKYKITGIIKLVFI